MVNYIRTVEVVYNDSKGSLAKKDVNKGFGGMPFHQRIHVLST